jgi:hypothetical protein
MGLKCIYHLGGFFRVHLVGMKKSGRKKIAEIDE